MPIAAMTVITVSVTGLVKASSQDSKAELLDVPVTTLLPGGLGPPTIVENPVANDPAALDRGMRYYISFNCVGCHAENGGGGMGPSLSTKDFIYGADAAQIYLSIAQGRPAGMPAWGKVLPEPAIWDLVTYIQSISSEPSVAWGRTTSLQAFDVQQVPAELVESPKPWQNAQPFSFGRNPEQRNGAVSN
jgi:cytochrome c oxidase cbb3-type subunit 3